MTHKSRLRRTKLVIIEDCISWSSTLKIVKSNMLKYSTRTHLPLHLTVSSQTASRKATSSWPPAKTIALRIYPPPQSNGSQIWVHEISVNSNTDAVSLSSGQVAEGSTTKREQFRKPTRFLLRKSL